MPSEVAKTPLKRPSSPLWWWLAIGALIAVKLWFTSAQTLHVIGEATVDDRLFIDLARSILSHEWLGAYEYRTLVKGPFYPLWIAWTFVAGVPLLLAQRVLYLVGSLAVVASLRPVVGSATARLGIFALLCFNPGSFAEVATTRVTRAGIYPALTLLVVAGALGMLCRSRESPRRILPWAVLTGSAWAAFSLTREEGVWLVPMLTIVLVSTMIQAYRVGGERGPRVAVCVLPVALWSIGLLGVSWMNLSHYGVFQIVEHNSAEVRDAFGALMRVRHEEWHPKVPVPREAREKIYRVSPAFAELAPWVEGRRGQGASKYGVTDDLDGGWFGWVVRSAASSKGHHESARSAAAYYGRLAAEVHAACADDRLDCDAGGSFLPSPWRTAYFRPLGSALVRSALFLSRFERIKPLSMRSHGQPESLRLFHDLTRERLSPHKDDALRIAGLAFSPSTRLTLSVVEGRGEPIESTLHWERTPGFRGYHRRQGHDYPTAGRARFVVETHCPKRCSLVLTGDGIPRLRVPLDGTFRALNRQDLRLELKSLLLGDRELLSLRSGLDRWRLQGLRKVTTLYQGVMPALGLMALVFFGVFSVLAVARRRVSTVWLIQIAILSSILSLLFILSFLEVSSFPAIRVNYLSPAYPLWLLFVALGVIEVIQTRGFQRRLLERHSRGRPAQGC